MHILEATNVFKRLAYLRIEIFRFDQRELAQDIGATMGVSPLTYSTISRIENENADNVPQLIYDYLVRKRVNMNWYHYGEGPVMLEGDELDRVNSAAEAETDYQAAAHNKSHLAEIVAAQQLTIESLTKTIATQDKLIEKLGG